MLTLEQALAALPDTADRIAARFAADGIKGTRKDDGCCPVAVYLTSVGLASPEVTENVIAVGGDDEDLFEFTPEHVVEFIQRFDNGAWPELVSDPEAADA